MEPSEQLLMAFYQLHSFAGWKITFSLDKIRKK